MKITVERTTLKFQRWCIWITFKNGKRQRLSKSYWNKKDAEDTAVLLKAEMQDAELFED